MEQGGDRKEKNCYLQKKKGGNHFVLKKNLFPQGILGMPADSSKTYFQRKNGRRVQEEMEFYSEIVQF